MAFATDLVEKAAFAKPVPASPPASERWLRALSLTAHMGDTPSRILPTVIDELAERFGDAPALVSDRESFSFEALAARSHRYARWALAHRLSPGATVCLLMPNRPEYLAVWLGITSVGGVVALLNTNLSGASLAHCISIVEPQHVIVADGLVAAFESAAPHLVGAPRVWVHGAGGTAGAAALPRIDLELDRYDDRPLAPGERPAVALADRALCIYTSGTTGLPKAANVSHHRVMSWSYWFAGIMATTADDRMYDCLPMYHSVGGIVAIGSVLVSGGSVVIREGFSARRFWEDVVRYDCSLFQYIGELCRYLLKAPPAAVEIEHRLRLCCGNGLRLDVWDDFKERFRIPQILEFYAATEGNFSLYNLDGKAGAVGRIPSFLAHRFPAEIVKFDVETGAPLRGENGFCVRCARNEVGEAIGRISSEPGGRFEGYTSAADTERKLIRGAFAAGDAWVRTGDLMRRDEKGYFYFVDRTGDTFRWKGENVATSEVSEAITSCAGVIEANVYGVAVPGTEGRAGMAALVIDPSFDRAALREHLAERLPAYARPLFLRVREKLEVTETFKQKKQHLVREGFDPGAIADDLFFDDAVAGVYAPLDRALFERIRTGAVRV